MIDAYYFIKYNDDTTLEHILKKSETNAVICFDFEDSIQNCLYPEENASLKQKARDNFIRIITKFHTQLKSCKVGVRLNNKIEAEQVLDIQALNSIKEMIAFHAVLLPKTESYGEIENLIRELQNRQINYKGIIPIIESKNGLDNLLEILKRHQDVIKNIAFGHCDYNATINAFPFFHQDSREYWKWICKIHTIIVPFKVKLINSAYLQLDNHEFFDVMLSYFSHICGANFGQVTLTYQQSLQCMNFNKEASSGYYSLKDRLIFKPDSSYAEDLLATFNNDSQYLGFKIDKNSRTIISPHEYVAAKKHISKQSNKDIELCFVGGCFTVQYNVLVEDNFLQLTKQTIEEHNAINLNINIIRYEKLANCAEKLRNQNQTIQADIIVFHIRPEPYLRMLKFYYKYKNNDGKIRKSINFSAINIHLSEKYDYLEIGIRYPEQPKDKKSLFHNWLIDMNYLSGFLLWNHYFAIKRYLKLTDQIIDYCNKENTTLIVLGPTIRFQTKIERMVSAKFTASVEKSLHRKGINFLSGIDKSVINQRVYFNRGSIFANEKYHKLISQGITTIIEKLDVITKYRINK